MPKFSTPARGTGLRHLHARGTDEPRGRGRRVHLGAMVRGRPSSRVAAEHGCPDHRGHREPRSPRPVWRRAGRPALRARANQWPVEAVGLDRAAARIRAEHHRPDHRHHHRPAPLRPLRRRTRRSPLRARMEPWPLDTVGRARPAERIRAEHHRPDHRHHPRPAPLRPLRRRTRRSPLRAHVDQWQVECGGDRSAGRSDPH